MVVAALFLQEFPTTMEFIGGLLIFAGTVVSGLDLQKKKKPGSEEVAV
jgi:drug/metabolite transporter (DMT)-like permease